MLTVPLIVEVPFVGRVSDLSPRQMEVTMLVATGLSDKEIGNQMCITRSSAHNHLSAACEKLNLHSRTELALFAVKAGLVKLIEAPPPYEVVVKGVRYLRADTLDG